MIINNGIDIVFGKPEEKDMKTLERWYCMPDCFGYATGFKNFSETIRKLKEPDVAPTFNFMIYNGETKEPIGFIYGYIKNIDKNAVLWISTLLIEPAFQNRGFGSRAINKLLNLVKSEYGDLICIVAVSYKNEQGLSFWEKAGFSHDPELEQSLHQFGTSQVAILKKMIK